MASNFDGLQVSGGVHGNFKCSWTIKDFSSLDSRVGKSHKSKVFQLEEKGMEWYLQIYPGGKKKSSEGYVSCYVHVAQTSNTVSRSTPDLNLKLNLSLRNTDGELLFKDVIDECVISSNNKGHGFLKTINANETVLVNDSLVVIVEASYAITYIKDGVDIYQKAEITPAENLVEELRKLWTSKQNTDCVISVGGEDIPAHLLVLGTRCKVFADMFERNTSKNSSRRVEVTDFEKDTINSFMEFLYTGNVREMDFDLALELLRASEKYEVSHLKSYCANYLMSLLDHANACLILASADMHNAETLRSHAMEYVCEKMSEYDLEHQGRIFKDQPELLWGLVKQLIKKIRR